MEKKHAQLLAELAGELEYGKKPYDQNDFFGGNTFMPDDSCPVCAAGWAVRLRINGFVPNETLFHTVIGEFGLTFHEKYYIFGIKESVRRSAKRLNIDFNKCNTAKDAAKRIDIILNRHGWERC